MTLFLPGENDRIEGKGHGNQVTGIVVKEDAVYTVGIDDTLKSIGEEGLSLPHFVAGALHFPRREERLFNSSQK